ncbi:MAG: hypothetical protein KF823_08185 [Xanthomonadales bacterium]|nr:hypothetical protein [Xanthomonadales bacterium]
MAAMTRFARLLIALVAAAPAGLVSAAGSDDTVRLRLALDPDGRVRLSTESPNYAPPPLRQSPLPMIAPAGLQRPGLAIDLRAGGTTPAGIGPCLTGRPAALGQVGACDAVGWAGLPGAIHSSDLVLELGGDRAAGVNLSFGLDWLERAERPALAFGPAGLPQLLPGQVGPYGPLEPLRSERVGLGGFLWLAPDLRLTLGLEHAEGSLALYQDSAAPWALGQRDSLSLGVVWGRFQGGLIGRRVRPDSALEGVGQQALDLGFSWRMPWNAAFEFGARNLITRPAKPDPAEALPEQGDLRTPYLRYHQDL